MALSSTTRLGAGWTWLRASRARLFAAVLLAVLIGVRGAAPFVVKYVIQTQAMAALDRQVDVAGVDLSFMQGRVGLERLYFGPHLDGATPSGPLAPGDVRFGARRVEVDLSLLALLRGDLEIDGLLVDTPRMLRLRDLGGSLPPLLRSAAALEDADASEGTPPPPISLKKLDIVNASYAYYDLSRPERQPLELTLGALQLGDVSLVDGAVEIASVEIREPSLRVINDFAVEALQSDAALAAAESQRAADSAAVAVEAADEPVPEPTPEPIPEAPPSIRIGQVRLTDASFSIFEDGDGPELSTALALSASDVSLDAGARFPIELSLSIESGSVTAKGEAGLGPVAYEGTLGWQDLPLADIARALGEAFPGELSSGSSSGDLALKIAIDADSGGSVQVSGRTDVTGFAASDGQGVDVEWQELAIVIEALDLDPSGERAPQVSLTSFVLRKPELSVVREASGTAPPEQQETAPGPQPVIRIGELDVSDGKLLFEDGSVKPRHRSEVRDFALSGKGIRWPERAANSLQVDGHTTDDSALSVKGAIGGEESSMDLVLSSVSLAAFSPYIADAAGYWVDRGRADLEASIVQRGDSTDVESALVLHRLSVTSVTPGTFQKRFGVPLDVALALLRDPKGNIRLPIDFSLQADSSDVDLGPIVLASLRQALVGALTSPLKGVGLLLESDDAEGGMALKPIAFEAGQVRLPASANIDRFGELLGERSGLALRLRGSVSPEDAAGIAEQVLTAKILADEELPPTEAGFLERRRIVSALKKRAEGEAGELAADDRAVLSEWLAAIATTSGDREMFAQRRSEAVRAAMLDLPNVSDTDVSTGAPVEGDPGVVIELAPKDD